MPQGGGVDLHAAKRASAARIASERLMSCLEAAASRASSSSAFQRHAPAAGLVRRTGGPTPTARR